MALISQDAAKRDAPSPQISIGPDYEAEAEQGRLKLRGDEMLRDFNRLNPQRTMWDTLMVGAGVLSRHSLVKGRIDTRRPASSR